MGSLDGTERKFNINDVLKKVFLKVRMHPKVRESEVIYSMDKSVPKLFRGKVLTLETYLVDIFQFVAQHINKTEIPVEITGPEEFLYTENLIFTIKDLELSAKDVLALSTSIEYSANNLGAKLYYSPTKELSIHIPFTLAEPGFRRHYRLPSKSLLQKRVLVMAQSQNITSSITKMFKYFPYNVDMSIEEFDENDYDLSQYDLLVIEDKLMSENLNEVCNKIQANNSLKLVILGDTDSITMDIRCKISASLVKPVTQESIFELIVSVFSDEYDSAEFLEKRKKLKEAQKRAHQRRNNKNSIVDTREIQTSKSDAFETILESKKNEYTAILDISLGKKNAKVLRLNYDDELEKFFDMFDGSDLYFRQIVNEKSIHKIKEFCIDLEKHSKIIGAQSMLKFTEIISLVFVYNKIDLLPIYPGRYHIELKKLFKEMEHYFSY